MGDKMYLLLLDESNHGNSLAAIREHQSELIAVDHINDVQPASTTIIKNNKLYIVVMDFVDLDNGNKRILVCKKVLNGPGDTYPYPEEKI